VLCEDRAVTEIRFRPARADDAGALSDLALRSKAHWGYDQDFLDRCRAALTFPPAEISGRRFVVAATAGHMIGFYSLDGDPPDGELGNLWLEPTRIGSGLGRQLWLHAVDTARATGFVSLRIDADPFAEGFYLAMGARRVGETPSDVIAGRVLPALRYDLDQQTTDGVPRRSFDG
jgi:GNAT superfamily N-acetyltransferase